jgi:hypothetical protein
MAPEYAKLMGRHRDPGQIGDARPSMSAQSCGSI